MKKIKIGYDNFLKKDIFKIEFEKCKLQLFNSEDVIKGNYLSNIAIGFVYNWKEDKPPQIIKDFFLKISNYAFLTGYWKTTNGAKYVFSNILSNPNVNKLVLFVFDKEDNGHLLVDSVVNFWKFGTNENQVIINSKSQNPRFNQITKKEEERIKKQCDLIVYRNIDSSKDLQRCEDLIKSLLQEPNNAKEILNNFEFYSTVIKNNKLYDDGARFFEPYFLDLSSNAKEVKFIEKYSNLPLAQKVNADNLKDALEMITAFIYKNGVMFKDQRGIYTMESRSFSVVIKNALEIIPNGFSKEYIDKYVDEFMNGKKNKSFAYTYHERIFKKWGNQVEKAIDVLKKDNNTRRCIISLWDPKEDLENNSPPCLNFIWLVLRNEELEMHVVFRSHHLATITKEGKLIEGEGAFVPNLYALATLQKYIALKINAKQGAIVLTDFSGHLYMSDV
jgi:thymidylate synthase (methanogen type)